MCTLHGAIALHAESAQSRAVMGPPLQPLWGQGLGFRGPGQLTWKCRKPDHEGCDAREGRCPRPACGFSVSLRSAVRCHSLAVHPCLAGLWSGSAQLVLSSSLSGAFFPHSPRRRCCWPRACGIVATQPHLSPARQRGTGGLGTWFRTNESSVVMVFLKEASSFGMVLCS